MRATAYSRRPHWQLSIAVLFQQRPGIIQQRLAISPLGVDLLDPGIVNGFGRLYPALVFGIAQHINRVLSILSYLACCQHTVVPWLDHPLDRFRAAVIVDDLLQLG